MGSFLIVCAIHHRLEICTPDRRAAKQSSALVTFQPRISMQYLQWIVVGDISQSGFVNPTLYLLKCAGFLTCYGALNSAKYIKKTLVCSHYVYNTSTSYGNWNEDAPSKNRLDFNAFQT